MESFKLSQERTQSVSLGCGTLILIALIVLIFSQAGTKDLERDVEAMRKDVKEMRSAVETQTRQLKSLQDSVAKLVRAEKEGAKKDK